MSILYKVFLVVLGLSVAFGVYVRVAPTDAEAWHRSAYPKPPGTYPAEGGHQVVRVVSDAEALAKLDEIIRATPRTQVVAGSVDEGMVTYVTRSALWGFPDYSTVSVGTDDDGQSLLTISGRLRFGRSDLGVNRARIEGWLAQLDAAQ